jgi:large repetitive protein
VALGGAVATDEDTPTDLTLNATDLDGDTLNYSVTASPTHGTLSGTAPNLTYAPDENFNGVDSFNFTASDGLLSSNEAIVFVNVNEVNDAPLATNDSYSTNEDFALFVSSPGVLANDTDVESSISALLVSTTAHGTLALNANGSFSYTPDADYNGPDSFTYKATDGSLDSNIATVNLTIISVNDSPVAADDNYSTSEDTPLLISKSALLANDTDVDGDSLSVDSFDGMSTNAGLVLDNSNGTLTFTPASDFFGIDAFNYAVSDGNGGTDFGHVTVEIIAVNDAPVSSDGSATTDEDLPKTIILNATDIDSSMLVFSIVAGPSNGSLDVITGNTVTFTPNADYNGPDSFTFIANDGSLDSNLATVAITINAVHDSPVAQDGSVSGSEDTPAGLILNATDVDGDALTYTVTVSPAHGSLSGIAPNLSYTPNSDFNGLDSFKFIANDGTLDSNEVQVSISLSAVNDIPVAINDTATTDEDTPKTLMLNATDVDSGSLDYTIVTGPSHGTISPGTSATRTYTPLPDYFGTDSFSFRASDGSLDSNVGTVTITVSPINDAPVLGEIGSKSVDELVALTFTATATDVEDDGLTFSLGTLAPSGASIDESTGAFAWTATEEHGPGTYTFDVIVTDSGSPNLSDGETITITVAEVNLPPALDLIATPITIDELTTASFTAIASDPDIPVQVLSFGLSGAPSGATIDVTTGAFSWTPGETQGPASYTFTVIVSDGTLSDSQEVTINVNEVNSQPSLSAIANQTASEHTAFTSTTPSASDSDIPTNTLTFSASGLPGWASINSETGVITGTPGESDGGTSNTIIVTVQDNGSPVMSASQTFTLSVLETNTAPTLTMISDQYATEHVAFTSISPSSSDSDLPVQTLTYSATGLPAWANINATTGVITGSPGETDGGTSAVVTVIVTDNGTPNLNAIRIFALSVIETYSIEGQKFEDLNGNKIKESSEPVLAGWTIYLDSNNNAALDLGEQSSVTDSSGNYEFNNLASGTYYVREVVQSGWHQTLPEKFPTAPGKWTVETSGGNDAINKDFGNIRARAVTGFFHPIDMSGVVNLIKAGQAVPAKFEIFIGGTEQTSVSEIVGGTVKYKSISCSNLSPGADDIEVTNTGATTLRYDSTTGHYIQNWKTPAGAGMCYSLTATLIDGSSIVAYFKTK